MPKKFTQQLNSNIKKIYLYNFLSGMFFSIPIIVIFWNNNGLTLFQIMILQSIFSVFTVVLEIPTGYFADIYGRKVTLILASTFLTIGITTYSLGHNFTQFLLAEIFMALSSSLSSGTISAFIYDTLQNLNRKKEYQKIWGDAFFYGMLALGISSVLGGFLAKINLRLTLYASIPFFALLVPLTFSLQEPKHHKLIFKKNYFKKILKTIGSALLKNSKLKWLIIYSGIIYAFNQSALWLYQPYFKLTGLNIVYFGIVFASFQIIAALSSKYAHKIEKYLGEKYSLTMLIFLIAISYLLMSNFIFLFSFSFCFIQQFVRSFKNIILTDYINQLTSSDIRATILSVESFFGRLLYAIIIPVFGWLADIYNLQQTLTIMGITTLISGITIVISLKKVKVI